VHPQEFCREATPDRTDAGANSASRPSSKQRRVADTVLCGAILAHPTMAEGLNALLAAIPTQSL
jgi:hypothetical protein